MILSSRFCRVVALATIAVALAAPVAQAQEFPFGLEMTLDAERQPGSKRLPTLEVGDDGEVLVELWCKGGKARFSIAGQSVVFVPGAMQERNCPPAKAQADDALLVALVGSHQLDPAGRPDHLRRRPEPAVSPQHQLIATR